MEGKSVTQTRNHRVCGPRQRGARGDVACSDSGDVSMSNLGLDPNNAVAAQCCPLVLPPVLARNATPGAHAESHGVVGRDRPADWVGDGVADAPSPTRRRPPVGIAAAKSLNDTPTRWTLPTNLATRTIRRPHPRARSIFPTTVPLRPDWERRHRATDEALRE